MRRFAWAAAVVLSIAIAAPAAAGSGVTYHGRLDGGQFRCGTTEVHPYQAVAGTWNLNVSGSTAVVTINVWYDGSHHLSFGMPGGSAVATATGVVVSFGSATATVAGDSFSWAVPLGYACPSEAAYDSLVYLGVVDR